MKGNRLSPEELAEYSELFYDVKVLHKETDEDAIRFNALERKATKEQILDVRDDWESSL